MRYQSLVCSGLAKFGVNMLTNLRYFNTFISTNLFSFQLCCSTDRLLLNKSFGFLCCQDLKYEENSDKAVQCLNDMVTNALIHVEDCLKYMLALRDPAIFRFCAIPQVAILFCGYFIYFRCKVLFSQKILQIESLIIKQNMLV